MSGKRTIGVTLATLAALLVPPLAPWGAAETRTASTPSATIWHLGHSGVAVETRGGESRSYTGPAVDAPGAA